MLNRVKAVVPLQMRKSAKISRARVSHRLGSTRYTYSALNQLDRKVLPFLPEAGVFLEVGANDGYSQSNTYHLEVVRGWRGILIEPVPALFARCQRLRTNAYCVNAACVASDNREPVELVDLDLMSVTLGQQDSADENRRLHSEGHRLRVEGRTLSSIIDESPFSDVDFMSVDVEGAEMSLLSGVDMQRHTPQYLLIESAYPHEVGAALAPFMAPVDQLSSHDYLFTRV